MKEKLRKIILSFKDILDYILVFLLLFLSIKKGGFYKTDLTEINIILVSIGIVYIISYYLSVILKKYIRKKDNRISKNKINEKKHIDFMEVLLLLLTFSYTLPILVSNDSNISDAMHEMIRYFNMYIIYFIVKRSNDKKVYLSGFVVIMFVQCLLAVDGISGRYLLPYLGKIKSGYLTSENLTRMSGTLQYANVFSMLCLLVNVFLLEKLKEKSKVYRKNIIDYFLIFVFTSSIILSKSRVVWLILFIYFIRYFNNKKIKFEDKLLLGMNLIISVIYTSIFMSMLSINIELIYTLTLIFYIIVSVINYMSDKLLNLFFKYYNVIKNNLDNLENKYKTKSKNVDNNGNTWLIVSIKKKHLVCIAIILMVCIYLVLAFNIKNEVYLSSNVNQNYIERNIYDLCENVENEIYINVEKLHEDSRYKIDIYETNKNLETRLLKTYNYYYSISDEFSFKYIPDENFKNLKVKITCEKNSIKIPNIKVNEKDNYINYLLLPTEFVYRISDSINGDSSLEYRLYYAKDALRIVTLNIKNFVFGLGGEGFNNTYELVKTDNYFSTEVHNVYLQIFVESGIIGFCIFGYLIYYVLKKYKYDSIKLMVIIFCLTSIIDLNFSYMFTMLVFGILLANLHEKE